MVRKQSYWAKSNQGKAGQVFLNNLIASAEKSSREAKKRKQQEKDRELRDQQKAAQIQRREEEKALERAMKKRERQRAREEKERTEKLKLEKKFAQLYERSKLMCLKHEIKDDVAAQIAELALKAGVNASGIEADIILPSIDKWRLAAESLRRESLTDVLDTIKSEGVLLDGHFARFSDEVLKTLPQPANVKDHKLYLRYTSLKQVFDKVTEMECLLREDLDDLEAKIQTMDNLEELRTSLRAGTEKKKMYEHDLTKRLSRFLGD